MPSLADTLVEILDDFRIPLPTATVRIVASARRGSAVTAESLGRLAGAQREEFRRSRRPPRLCDVLDEHARAVRPRVWARGEWRLARRLATPDALPGWQAGLAWGLCREMQGAGTAPPKALGGVALEAVARVLGPVAGYLPGDPQEWERFGQQIATRLPGPGLAAHTVEQERVERRLRDHQPRLPAESLYFGLPNDFRLGPDERDPQLLRLPQGDERGEPFYEVLRRRVRHEADFRSLVAYLQGYSYLMDELERGPTAEEFASHWRFSFESVRADEALFARAFPEERTPERLLRLLEHGLPRGGMAWLLDVHVVDLSSARPHWVTPAPGQRWRAPDGREVSIIEADEHQVTGGLHDAASGTTAVWVGEPRELDGWTLVLPEWAWRVSFDLSSATPNLLEHLACRDVVVDRLARPGDPRPGHRHLPAATVVGHVIATGEQEARDKILQALEGQPGVYPGSLRVEQLGRPDDVD